MNANFNSLAFGFSTVNAGQRNVVAEPLVIVTSTEGSFRVTAPVTRALGIAAGDNIMFLSNADNIDAAIEAKADIVKQFCEEQGLELGSDEARIEIHKTFDSWAIAKGVQEFDAKGNMKVCKERLNKSDKVKFVTTHFTEMLEAAMADASEEVKDALSHEGVTEQEQIDILVGFVTPRELPKFTGSKTAHSSNLNGIGLPLNFTDSNVWKQLKFDMGEEATKANREYSVDIENIQTVQINNGYESVEVKALVLGEHTDKEPAHVGRAKDEDAE